MNLAANSFPEQSFPPYTSLTSCKFRNSCQIHWRFKFFNRPAATLQNSKADIHLSTYEIHTIMTIKHEQVYTAMWE